MQNTWHWQTSIIIENSTRFYDASYHANYKQVDKNDDFEMRAQKSPKIYLGIDAQIRDNGAQTQFIYAKFKKQSTMYLNIWIAIYATMTHRWWVQTLNKYEKQGEYTNICLAFSMSMTHGLTKWPRCAPAKHSRF